MNNSTKLSRRTLVRKASLAAAASVLGLASSDSTRSQNAHPAANSPGPRALALIGDRFHNADYIRVALDRTFKELNIPIDYTIRYDQISASMLKGYRLFLCLRDGMIWPGGSLGPDSYTDYERNLEDLPARSGDPKPEMCMTEEQGAAIKEFVNSGR